MSPVSLIENIHLGPVSIDIVPGGLAPRYGTRSNSMSTPSGMPIISLSYDGDECGALAAVRRAVITEQGTAGNLPIVDLIGEVNGKKVVLVISGRLLDSIASALRGVNLRIHGKERP